MKKKEKLERYTPVNKIKFITATALFDGHDASINIIRRLLQSRGAEVVHLGHNRSATEIVEAAIQEDVQAIALSSYQGGHLEFFSYILNLLKKNHSSQIKVFGGGGGVISLTEVKKLEQLGIEKIYTPEDGQELGLNGMIGDILMRSDFLYTKKAENNASSTKKLARLLTLLENQTIKIEPQKYSTKKTITIGLTGTGGAGKSSLLDELLHRFLYDYKDIKIAVLCFDPSKKKTGGALLGDRIRINSCSDSRIFLHSFANRQSNQELSTICLNSLSLLKEKGNFDLIFVETSGIGQGDSRVIDIADISLYVMTPEYGASSQLEKIDMLDYADLIAINKFDRPQAKDALKDVEHTLRRNRYSGQYQKEIDYPIFGTMASQFNDQGTNGLYQSLVKKLSTKTDFFKAQISPNRSYARFSNNKSSIIPNHRKHYLSTISNHVKKYHIETKAEGKILSNVEALEHTINYINKPKNDSMIKTLHSILAHENSQLKTETIALLNTWTKTEQTYKKNEIRFNIRDKEIKLDNNFSTISKKNYPRVIAPTFSNKIDTYTFLRKEHLPGFFPYTSGTFPFKRRNEDPLRQFAGEGGPNKTNKRFHYLCQQSEVKRLSTAFDSITLYGADPHSRPDIYGKIGESGVSIAHLEDMKALFKNIDLCAPQTSVSMTINGPAPILLALFFNTAIDQQVDTFTAQKKRIPTLDEYTNLFNQTIQTIRGTVQADILKEDQAQNTCIFSTNFALKMMGDIQEYFIKKKVRNYYSVSISGYHIAEAGANPITQLAFTLANGFTYVEYYLARGFHIDDFAPNLSFFFSNGLDTEYTVLGRVARRIWAIAMKYYYKGNTRSQKLKYHIQTSGRSLHAQEMTFNDIRTTLQALTALNDNCNSLHTNASDEALTTPTEESVRQAVAIQMIINKEFGASRCENNLQGSFFVDYLTDQVEQSVLKEFEKISDRGGVIEAMELQYQRSKVQDESLYYEQAKDLGDVPIVGVNTFLKPNSGELDTQRKEAELTRASYHEKDDQINRLDHFKEKNKNKKEKMLYQLKQKVIKNDNIFEELLLTVRYCTLNEITTALYEVGGQYRRSM